MKVVHQAFPGPPPPCVSHRGAYVDTARVIYYTLTPDLCRVLYLVRSVAVIATGRN